MVVVWKIWSGAEWPLKLSFTICLCSAYVYCCSDVYCCSIHTYIRTQPHNATQPNAPGVPTKGSLHLKARYSALQHTATQCKHTATHCNTLQHIATHCNTPRAGCLARIPCTWGPAATRCNTPQRTATHYNTLQHITTHYNTPGAECPTRIPCTLRPAAASQIVMLCASTATVATHTWMSPSMSPFS